MAVGRLVSEKQLASKKISEAIRILNHLPSSSRKRLRNAFETGEWKDFQGVAAIATRKSAGSDAQLQAIHDIKEMKVPFDTLRSEIRNLENFICKIKHVEVSSSKEFDTVVALAPRFTRARVRVHIPKSLSEDDTKTIKARAEGAGYKFQEDGRDVYI